MRAFGFREHGGPDQWTFFGADEPDPGPGEVLLDVDAVALNHLDLWVREGWPGLDLELPHIAGTDCAGTVAELGEGVAGPAVGTKVVVNPSRWCGACEACLAGEQSMCRTFSIMGEHRAGALTERIAVPVDHVRAYPDTLSVEEAAASPLVFQTVWRMANRGRVRPGHTVLVPGAGGGIATAAIQVAKHLGARVIATTSTKQKAERARELGADEVVLYTDDDWGRQVYQLTGKQGLDVVLDSVAEHVWSDALRALKPGGRIVCCGATGGFEPKVDPRYVFFRQLEIVGSTMANAREFDEAMALVFAGKLAPVVDRAFPFEEAEAAMGHLEAGEHFGKLVVSLR